ncbi:MAG: 2-C-methyl-D-erythritol 4-phosphate cytidylyltransferase [Lachnospiraceae bacterium]|nr:2-C-methyl-D-erythritol 4-phosphate cytidylyltransferase [Lachnospiraceae bacterium]
MKKESVAIVLAAGRGSRMQSHIPKQYMQLGEKPLLYYALKAFQDSFVDRIVLVTAKGDIDYCQKDIVKKYGLHKVNTIISGGKERYHSVYQGLQAAGESDYIFIHDGARPFVTEEILLRAYADAQQYGACVVGMPAKDTIRIADQENFVESTPKRNQVWVIQTPQVFQSSLIRQAYSLLMAKEAEILEKGIQITDDGMVVETFTNQRVRLTEGSYVNIKITTPEDLKIAESLRVSLD